MTYTLKYHPKVKTEDLPRLDHAVKNAIKRSIEKKLINNPLDFGIPLRKTLKPYLKLRVGDYRVAFKVDEKSRTIFILTVSHRKNVYQKASERK